MSKIKVNDDFDVDVSSAQFVSQGATTAANVYAPQALAAAAEGIKKVYMKSRDKAAMAEADGTGKSLLEEFTGEERFKDIASRESAVLAEEEKVALQMSKFQPGDVGFEESHAQFVGIQEMKDKLEREREAVVQGLLSEDEYRKRAETSYYQIVAMSPGIRTELAQIMGERLGIDPRGQTAKITMDARRDLKEKNDTATKKIVTELVDRGYWDADQSQQANIMAYWPVISKGIQAQTELKNLVATLDGQKNIDEAEQRAVAKNARQWWADSEQMTLYNMGAFEGHNVFNMTPEEIVRADPALKATWVQHIQSQALELTTALNGVETVSGQPFNLVRESINGQAELLISILSSEQLNDQLEANFKTLEQRNKILVESAKAGIAIAQPNAVKLAAYSDFFNISNMIQVNSAGSTMILQGLTGNVPNLENLDPADKSATLTMYQQSLAGVSKAYADDPKRWNDSDIQNMSNVALMVAKQPADAIDDKSRMQLFKLVAQDDWLARVEAINPRAARDIKQGVIQHQQAIGQSYNKEIENILATTGTPLDSLDFHLEKGEVGWMVMPNEDVDQKLIPPKMGVTPLPNQIGLEAALNRKDQQLVEGVKTDLITTMNRTRGLINNLVKSRAQVTGLSEAEAAKAVAKDLGINLVSKPPKGPKGFAEAAGLKGDANPAKNKPKEPAPQAPAIDPNLAAMQDIADKTGASIEEIKAFLKDLQQGGRRPAPGDADFDANAVNPSQ